MSGRAKGFSLSSGRASQKNRTRAALIEAAGKLLQSGRQPTVSEAAEAASISRATAYRYFPTQEMLLAEVTLFSVGGPLFAENDSLLVPEAVAQLVRRVADWAYQNEQTLRMFLRLSLDPHSGVQRPGHRREWIAQALRPARNRFSPRAYRHLIRALTLLLGIDPVIVMTDIARASRKEAIEALEWTARTLVDAALKESESACNKARKRS